MNSRFMPRKDVSKKIKRSEPTKMDIGHERIRAFSDVLQYPKPLQPERCLHFHEHYELLYITRGVRAFYLGGKIYEAEAGDLMVFRPGDAHVEFAGSKKISYFVFRFTQKELIEANIEFPSFAESKAVINLPRKQEFFAIFDRMMEEYAKPREGSEILLGAYLVEFVVKLRRCIQESHPTSKKMGAPSQERVRVAMDLLQKDVTHAVNLSKLAHKTFMSVSHLAHTFKEQVGESPRRYQIQERIRQAKSLLLETDKPAVEIAEQLGYKSPYFFYRQFRAKTGMTTEEFRERFHPA